ncbi:hypothetical protein AAFN85_15785 [Mucilaginibacter sp. CAU 1740]|uniref:hypothetical protein n=1 Tax=Mucilaginibacter sp. CAU 1740 TaxID=3140365 RepID=UPI00325BAF48
MKKIVLTLVLSIVLFIVFLIVVFWRNSRSVAAANAIDNIKITATIPPKYLKLFNDPSKLKLDKTMVSRDRNPVSLFDYGKQFSICVYQIDAPQNINLKKITTLTSDDTRPTDFYLFNIADAFTKYDLLYRTGPQDKVSGIFLNLFGNNTTEIANNDSLVYYYSEANNFYIKYQKNGVQDFCMEVKYEYEEERIKISSEIMIKKFNKAIYLIILTANNEIAKIKQGTLFELTKGDLKSK